MIGWIKLHRTIDENEFYFDERFTKTQAWIDLLILATHKERTVFIRGVELHLKPGDLCYSMKSLAKRWKWNQRTVLKYLNLLKNRQMIQTRITNVTTIISVINWGLYQDSTTQSTNQSTTQNKTRIQTNKNGKNVENVKEDIPLLGSKSFVDVWEAYKAMRVEKKKALTPTSEHSALKKVLRLSGGSIPVAVKIVTESIDNGWQGLFSLKTETLDEVRRSAPPKKIKCEYCDATYFESNRYDHEKEGVCPGWKSADPKNVVDLVTNFKLGGVK